MTVGGLCSVQTFLHRILGAAFLLLFEAQVSGFDWQRHGQEDAHDVEAEVPRSAGGRDGKNRDVVKPSQAEDYCD